MQWSCHSLVLSHQHVVALIFNFMGNRIISRGTGWLVLLCKVLVPVHQHGFNEHNIPLIYKWQGVKDIDDLEQDCGFSIAKAMGIPQSCTSSSICTFNDCALYYQVISFLSVFQYFQSIYLFLYNQHHVYQPISHWGSPFLWGYFSSTQSSLHNAWTNWTPW